MTDDQLPPCGHEECRRPEPMWVHERDEQEENDAFLLARSLGFRQMEPGVMAFATTDPEEFQWVMRQMTGGIDGAARDVIAQSEELARRASKVAESMGKRHWYARSREELQISMDIKSVRGGRHAMRKVGRRAFWQEVFRWFRVRKTR